MNSVTLGFCEVNSCNQQAENEFDLNGVKKYVCSKHSFLSFRSPESIIWKILQDRMPIHFHDRIPIQYEARELTENAMIPESIGANLRIIKFD